LEELLTSGEIELAASLLPVSEDFEWQDVRRETLSVLVSAKHPLASRRSLDLPALRDLPFILFETGFALNRIILDACKRHGFDPPVVARSSQIDFIVELAAADLGIAFLPRMIADQRKHSLVRCIPLSEPDIDWHIAMIWRRGGFLSHAAKAWLEFAPQPRTRNR
jgi:DNA-binding transcriptional LysR family regulator